MKEYATLSLMLQGVLCFTIYSLFGFKGKRVSEMEAEAAIVEIKACILYSYSSFILSGVLFQVWMK